MILVRVHEHDHPVGHRIEVFPCTIGRSMHARIWLDEPTVDGLHAEIRADADGLLLVDLGSANGITVAGIRVSELRLKKNETVHLGEVEVDLIVVEELAKTKVMRLPKEPFVVSSRHEIPLVILTALLSYAALCFVPASDHYKEYWPPERPYEILGAALSLWAMLIGGAFVLSLFSKLNSKRFHFRQILILMVGTFVVGHAFQTFAPTLEFNLHNFAGAAFLQHLGYGLLAFAFFYSLQQYAFLRWSQRLRALVAGGIALAVMLLVAVYVDSKKGVGDRERMADLGLPLLDPQRVDRSPDDLLFDMALKVAESDQNRIRILEKLEAEKD